MKIITKILILSAAIVNLFFVLSRLFGHKIIPDCFMTFSVSTIAIFVFVFYYLTDISSFFQKEILNQLKTQCAICFIQYIMFGGLTSLFAYFKIEGFIYPFVFLAMYSLIKIYVYTHEAINCNLKTKSMIYLIDNKYKKELLKNNVSKNSSIQNKDESAEITDDYLNSINSYVVYIETYIYFITKRIEPMIILIAGVSVISGIVSHQNYSLLGGLILIAALFIAIVNFGWTLDKAKTSESLSELYTGCSYKCKNEVKRMITDGISNTLTDSKT